MRLNRFACAALAAGVGCLAPSVVEGSVIAIASNSPQSTEGLGTFTGSMNYSYVSGNMGTLVISLTNTSPVGNGGKLTGFVFNINSIDAGASASLNAGATHPFANLFNESASPFGTYRAGAALGGDFLGGGSPNAGIAVGATGTFTFTILASDAASLTASSFFSTPENFAFIARFKGFLDGGSDKVPGTNIPAPGALALVTAGGLLAGRRRR
ncbi:MAG: hypothetical protein KF805_16545 [Phycisphaeraceae bacterium]|nr:hypothetical protein [Phycisphaeraceae bacterium]